jgi:C4-type Zn-finger protein
MKTTNLLMMAADGSGAGGGGSLQTMEQLAEENKSLRARVKELEGILRKASDHIENLESDQDAKSESEKLEKRVRDKISESGGALGRDQAMIVIRDQDEHAARLAAAKASKKK